VRAYLFMIDSKNYAQKFWRTEIVAQMNTKIACAVLLRKG